jgi:hypothetical protein
MAVDGLDSEKRVCRRKARKEVYPKNYKEGRLYLRIWNLIVGFQCRAESLDIRELDNHCPGFAILKHIDLYWNKESIYIAMT